MLSNERPGGIDIPGSWIYISVTTKSDFSLVQTAAEQTEIDENINGRDNSIFGGRVFPLDFSVIFFTLRVVAFSINFFAYYLCLKVIICGETDDTLNIYYKLSPSSNETRRKDKWMNIWCYYLMSNENT